MSRSGQQRHPALTAGESHSLTRKNKGHSFAEAPLQNGNRFSYARTIQENKSPVKNLTRDGLLNNRTYLNLAHGKLFLHPCANSSACVPH